MNMKSKISNFPLGKEKVEGKNELMVVDDKEDTLESNGILVEDLG